MAILNDALYYPFIELPNDSWFRSSILFWDTINPIVPREVYHHLKPNSFLKLLQANGAAKPIYPDDYSQGRKGDLFKESVIPYAEKIRRRIEPPEDISAYSKVHRHKMPWELQQELEHMGLLRWRSHHDDWFYLYTPLADVFMGELARIISVDRDMTPTTDQDEYGKHIFGAPMKRTSIGFIQKSLASRRKPEEDERETLRKVALRFLFKKVLPTPSSNFDIETLLRIKDDNKKFLYKFRNSFHTALKQINENSSREEMIEGLQRFHDKIRGDVLRLKELFLEYDEDVMFSDIGAVFSLDKPAKALAAVGLTAAAGLNAVGITVSPLFYLALVGYVWFEGAKGRREIRKGIEKSLQECDGAYVFKLRKELAQYKNSGVDEQPLLPLSF